MEQNAVKKMSLKAMWDFILFETKGFWLLKLAIIFGALSTAAIPYLNNFFYSSVLNRVIGGEYDTAMVMVVSMSILIFVVNMLSKACENVIYHFFGPTQYEVKKRTARKVFTMEYEKVERAETKNDFRRVRAGENGSGGLAVQLNMIRSYFTSLTSIIFAVGFIILLFSRLNPSNENLFVAVLMAAGFVALFIIMMLVNNVMSKLNGKKGVEVERENERYNTIGAYLGSILESEKCSKDIRIYQMGDYLMEKEKQTLKAGEEYTKYGKFNGRCMAVGTLAVQIFAGFTYAFVAVKAAYGSIAIGDILMYAGAVITLGESLREAQGLHNSISYSNSYLKLYEEFINRPRLGYEGTLPVEKRDDNQYTLEFRNVWFRYAEEEDYVLKDFSLRFNIGERLALVGLNGAGKTTVVKLLTRMYDPEKGQILLNGIDIKKYDFDEYMTVFSVVFQDFNLFAFPLDENVAGGYDVEKPRLQQALDKVGLSKWVEELPDKERSLLYKENGDGVVPSGGEAQKLAIARALYKDAPFIIMDEPTAALDPLAEAEIYENFNSLINHKTAIYISHRMSSCKFCDRIVVLKDGSICEQGNHNELMELSGVYAMLYNTQAEYYN